MKQNSERTRGSSSGVLHALYLQTQAQLSLSAFALVLTAAMPNGQMGQWGRTFTWEPDRGVQTSNARQLSVKPPNCHRECERVSAWSSISNPSSPTPLLLTLTLLPLNSPAPPCLSTPSHTHTHIITPQSIQTDTHHHFYTSLTPPPPTLPEHTYTSTPPVNQRPGCHAVTVSFREKGKGKMAEKVSISHFITLSRLSGWWHKEEKEKKSVRKAIEKEIWMKKSRGVDGKRWMQKRI